MKRVSTFMALMLGVVVFLPDHNPMFPGMIVRCDDSGKCHWECEFGVVTSTVMVRENLVVEPTRCSKSTDNSSGIIYTMPGYKYNGTFVVQN